MEQKIKFIIIGLVGFCMVCLFLFIQASSQQQKLLRESNDLKTENTALVSRASKFENDLREMQGKLSSLKNERDRGVDELNELQKKYDAVARVRDELIEKLKNSSQSQVSASPAQSAQPLSTGSVDNDAYWGAVLKAKTELEMQLASLKVELRSLQVSNEALQRDKSVLGVDITALRNDKKDLLRQLSYNQKLLDSMSQEVVREKNDKVAIQESFKTIRAENNALGRQLKSLVGRKEALDKKVLSLQEGKLTVEKRLNEMESMLTDKISKIDSLKNELDLIKGNKAEDSIPPVKATTSKDSVELPAIVIHSAPEAAKASPPAQDSNGKILAVNLDSNFVVIDQGSSAGVSLGDVFSVYRGVKEIGSIGVIQTRASISACDIKKMTTPLKIGDSVK